MVIQNDLATFLLPPELGNEDAQTEIPESHDSHDNVHNYYPIYE